MFFRCELFVRRYAVKMQAVLLAPTIPTPKRYNVLNDGLLTPDIASLVGPLFAARKEGGGILLPLAYRL